ncbi:DNA repair protein endonuclease SAE2/CtIP C-terminus-domain-containing protein [Phaeosphaeriaceae sp. PMI808]|nr:DNA repair protein endonuclease SAE2/CtIP C-terminus-domain-containing protein [Phaeosphaeriaceae sp. PMI808]
MPDFSDWIVKNKALWTRVYDEVIAPDLEEEWKKRDEAHEKELKQKEENQQILFNHVEIEVVKNSHLALENDQLRKQLEDLTTDAAPRLDGDTDHVTNEEKAGPLIVCPEEHDDLVEKYSKLNKKYQDLSQKIKYLERKNNAVMQKNKDMKDSVRAWQEYADRQSGKQKHKHKIEREANGDRTKLSAVPQIEDAHPCIPSSPRSMGAAGSPPPPLTERGLSSPAPFSLLAVPEIGSPIHSDEHSRKVRSLNGSVTPKRSTLGRPSEKPQTRPIEFPSLNFSSKTKPDSNAVTRFQSHEWTTHLNSSQTTVDEITEQPDRDAQFVPSASDDGDDSPQFVSARCLKRKRDYPIKTEVYPDHFPDGTPAKPFRVKEEPTSSPPSVHSLVRKETIDLDDPVAYLLQTPHRSRRKFSNLSAVTGPLHHQRSSSAPFTQAVKRENTHSGHLLETPNVRVHLDPVETTNTEIRALSEPSDATQNVDNVLRHLDPNVIADSLTEHTRKRMKRSEARKQNEHRILTESGEEPPPVDVNATRLAPSLARAKLNCKLHSPNSPHSHTTGLDPTVTPATKKIKAEQDQNSSLRTRSVQTRSAKAKLREPPSEPQPTTPDHPTTDSRPQWIMKAAGPRPSTTHKASPTSPKEPDRLRSKPITELKLQDFRPNPAYNQGYSYAFSETVRKRGDRMCLPGCTNTQCCGSTFRTFAEAQGALSSSQEDHLLQDYLGDAYDNMHMTQMSSEEREELVLQARTRKMAKEAGKHREAYERRRTPPGFWRVDFPSTQEREGDREAARVQERAVVRERWLETQRKGGKWIFRDE